MGERVVPGAGHTLSKIAQVISAFVVVIGIVSLIGNLTDTVWSLPFENVLFIYKLFLYSLIDVLFFWLPSFSAPDWLKDFVIVWAMSFFAMNLVFIEYTNRSIVGLLFEWYTDHIRKHYADYQRGDITGLRLGLWLIVNTAELIAILASSYFVYFIMPLKTKSFEKALSKSGLYGDRQFKSTAYLAAVLLATAVLLGLNTMIVSANS